MHKPATDKRYYGYYDSTIGTIEIAGTSSAITSLNFVKERREGVESCSIVDEAVRQVAEYFAGSRREFDVPFALSGTDFQRRVWQQLLTVPYGQTATYQEVATALGNPKAVRAVGAANGRNPISIIVPCHRIVGSDGRLVGYGGDLWRKEWLLSHEGCPH
jgi:methylated-DNA-[protein]-cysteine S-methyltransferase